MANALNNIDWSQLIDMDVDNGAERLLDIIKQTLDLFALEKTVNIPYKNILREPWMTAALLKLSQKRKHLFRLTKGKLKTCNAYIEYITATKHFNKSKYETKQAYYSEELSKFQNDSRKTWQVLNTLIGRKNDKSSISDTFEIKAKITSDPKTIANGFCD